MSNPEDSKQNSDPNPDGQIFEEEEQEFNATEEEEEEAYTDSQISSPVSLKISTPSNEIDPIEYQLSEDVKICKEFYIGFDFTPIYNRAVTFKIPTSILPLTVQVVNGFYHSPTLAECNFEFTSEDLWKARPFIVNIKNPIYGTSFPGSLLIQNRLNSFFNPDFKPQERYRCQSYVLAPQTVQNPANINELIEQLTTSGFTEKQSEKALQFCSYDIEKARDYLITGMLEPTSYELPFSFRDCRLFYLILEICESFFDMCDCCCNCGEKLGVYSLKLSCCSKDLCKHAFLNLGVGANIVGEIKRDQLANDLLISLASCAFNAPKTPPVFEPSPESQGLKLTEKFFKELPPMNTICQRCNNDTELIDLIGIDNFNILRFFILSNKAQLINLNTNQSIKIPKFKGYQFLATFVSPESELKFLEKKKQFGAKWFWHGSRTERWYRILHTGLKDYGNTKYQLHAGPIYGDGIYMSDSYQYSSWYCNPADNKYAHSVLPKQLLVISLTENAAVPDLVGPVHPNEFTQRDDNACITRILLVSNGANHRNNYSLVGSQYDFNTLKEKLNVPSLNDILKDKMESYKKNSS